MALKVTVWRPDTCGCEIHYEWDDTLPQDQRTHALKAMPSVCPHHAPLAGNATRYTEILAENTGKNKALGVVESIDPALIDQCEWSFDSNRKLVLNVPSSSKVKIAADLVTAGIVADVK